MPFDASERAFKIFTEAYGKAWSPDPKGLAVLDAPIDIEHTPLKTETARARSKRRSSAPPIRLV